MILAEHYKDWVLPALLKISTWNEYIDALLGEIVTLQMYNMGSYNAWGFNGVQEDLTIENTNEWMFGTVYYPERCEVDSGGGFSLDNDSLVFDGNSVSSLAIYPYAFVQGRKYIIRFDVEEIYSGNTLELNVGIGKEEKIIDLSLGVTDPLHVEIEVEANDYYMFFSVASGMYGQFKIRNLDIVGVLNSFDEKERILVLKRLVNVDRASRDILERMRDSISFPGIAGMPESLLRQIIKDHNKFIGYAGSELAASMFFYFLGYEVEFAHLYAAKGDYESEQFTYIAQKEDDLLESVPGTKVYGQVASAASASYKVVLKDGHQVIAGDFISDQTNPFVSSLVEVLSVSGNEIMLLERVTVFENDYIDIYRVYPYAVNPDPDNYMKTSHIDVFFKRKYLEGVDLDFSKLEQFFVRYLPVNVVIRFFGFKTEPDDEYFSFRETSFSHNPIKQEDLAFTQNVTYPEAEVAFVVQNPAPFTHVDIYGNNVDGYSYLCSHIDPGTGEPIYLVIPLT